MAKEIKYILTPAQLLDLQKLIERISLHLEINQGGIFIIGTDSDETKIQIENTIRNKFSKDSWLAIDLRKSKDPLLNVIANGSIVQKKIYSINFLNSIDSVSYKNIWQSLNFRREYIFSYKLILILWVYEEKIIEIPGLAKDFWSFRTDVFYLSSQKLPAITADSSQHLKVQKEINELLKFIEKTEKKPDKDIVLLGNLYSRLGGLFYSISQFESAITAYKKVEDLFIKLGNQRQVVIVRSYLSSIYHSIGQLDITFQYQGGGKVFISYSHDSKEHMEKVLTFANLLRKDGIDCVLDQYFPVPPEGRPRWMEKNIEGSEFVLLICTRSYLDSVKGKKGSSEACWEGNIIHYILYESDLLDDKFIPILFAHADKEYIPQPLSGKTSYVVSNKEEYIQLYRHLTHQSAIKKPELGGIYTLGTKEYPKFFSQDGETRQHMRIETTKLPVTGPELFGREEQLKLLDKAWDNPHTHVLSFIAAGGVGKSALVNGWLHTMEADNFRSAEYVYGWSFYSQGITEQTQVSSDTFFNDCLTWFGYTGKPPTSQFGKGKLLARILTPKRCLLLLDGLESLQYPPGPMCGKLKDLAMQALLKGISRSFAGLCVITSRCSVEDIKTIEGNTTFTCNLENLDEEAGKRLLESYGTKGPEMELRVAVKEFKGHALALHLLGSYLKTVHSGDIRKRDKIGTLTKAEKFGGHTIRVMEAYEIWLKKDGRPELEVLYLLGLFDKFVETGAMDVLKQKPPIHGLTERLTDMPYDNWQATLSHLQELKLISQSYSAGINCHPLVQEYFGEKLMQQNPKAWKQAHQRVYEYYRNLPEKELPDTLEEMRPLFAAVRHGCLAGKHQEVFQEVFWKRIQRKNEFYIILKLGAFGIDLSCLSYFFEVPWYKPAPGLVEQDKAVVLIWAGIALRALGRPGEALEPIKAGLQMHITHENWNQAALDANNISELLLSLGNLKQSLDYGKKCVEYADKSGDAVSMERSRGRFADTLFQAGTFRQAEELFAEAEAMQKKRQPGYPYLYSVRGFLYRDLLLSQGKYEEVLERARTSIEQMIKIQAPILTIALDNLSIGKALLFEAIKNVKPDVSEVEQYLHRAVDGLLKAGQQDYLIRGLFSRAALYRYKKEFTLSWEDLEEAREIAFYGSMRLHLTDYYLEACINIYSQLLSVNGHGVGNRFYIIEQGERVEMTEDEMKVKYREFWGEAERLISETGYHRRDTKLTELKKWLKKSRWK